MELVATVLDSGGLDASVPVSSVALRSHLILIMEIQGGKKVITKTSKKVPLLSCSI